MTTLRTEALILRAVDFRESDRILHLLLPGFGRMAVIARGARRSIKRFAGTLDLFNHLRVQIDQRRSSNMGRLDQAQLVRGFAALRVDPVRFAMGCYLLELLDRLAPEGGSPDDMRRLFDFALQALESVSARRPDQQLRTILELRALAALGLRPELARCVRCGAGLGAGAEVDFHVAEGGPVCGRCAARLTGLLRIHLGTLRALEQGLRLDLERLDRLILAPGALEEARSLVDRFQRFHVGVELRSQRFLEQMLPARGALGPLSAVHGRSGPPS
ncbi:MAG: DNA repair protein RecO [Myxococcales bacterium]|nr:DNA repair protein RecO [Myxococcales bacterium]MDH5306804.1 DNA repair protein RecO [Myxococcales bacterium]MDH5567972.1 DNA repair protein RecO [Myxococcales bacterium]